MVQTSIPIVFVTLAVVVLAAVWDMRTGRIPNHITFTGICLGLALNTLDRGSSGLSSSVLGLLAGGGFLFIPFALGGIGPGDVKLLAAVGSLNGVGFVTQAFLFTAVAGGLIAGALAVTLPQAAGGAMGLVAAMQSRQPFIRKETLRKSFPYGAAILAGTVMAYAVRWIRV